MAKVAASDNLQPKTVFDDKIAASDDQMSDSEDSGGGGIKMKKELGLIDGVAIIVGVIVGAGIFVSPKGVLLYSRSIGQAIIVWILSGVLSMVGALCYAELGESMSEMPLKGLTMSVTMFTFTTRFYSYHIFTSQVLRFLY